MSQPDLKASPRGVMVDKPRFNIYTMMLVLSFIALLVGCLCLYGEMSAYSGPTGRPWDTRSAQVSPIGG
jgi:hypothetical protein